MNIKSIKLLILAFFPFLLSAQPWMKAPYLNVAKESAGYNDMRRAFYDYWGDAPYIKGKEQRL